MKCQNRFFHVFSATLPQTCRLQLFELESSQSGDRSADHFIWGDLELDHDGNWTKTDVMSSACSALMLQNLDAVSWRLDKVRAAACFCNDLAVAVVAFAVVKNCHNPSVAMIRKTFLLRSTCVLTTSGVAITPSPLATVSPKERDMFRAGTVFPGLKTLAPSISPPSLSTRFLSSSTAKVWSTVLKITVSSTSDLGFA